MYRTLTAVTKKPAKSRRENVEELPVKNFSEWQMAMPVWPSICLSVYLFSVCPSIFMSLCLSVCLCVH